MTDDPNNNESETEETAVPPFTDDGETGGDGTTDDVEHGIEQGFALAEGRLSLNDLGIESPVLQSHEPGDDEVLHSLPIRLSVASLTPVANTLAGKIRAHPDFQAASKRLLEEVGVVSQDLHAAIRQDVVVHRFILQQATGSIRETRDEFARAIDRWELELARAEGNDALLASAELLEALEIVEHDIRTSLEDTLLRKLERYYESDPAIIGLEQALSRLEILPLRIEPWLRIDLDDGTASRMDRLLQRAVVHLPMGRALQLGLIDAKLHDLTKYFPRILKARRRIRKHIAQLAHDADMHIERIRVTLHGKDSAEETEEVDLLEVGPRSMLRQLTTLAQEIAVPIVELRDTYAELDESVTTKCKRLAAICHDASNHTSFRDRSRMWAITVLRTIPYKITQRISAFRGANIERQQLRVLYHPEMRSALADLRRTLADNIATLRDEIDADMEVHVDILDKLEKSMKDSAERMSSAFEKHVDSSRWEKRRVVRVETRRQIKRVYNTYERRVIGALWMHYGADPLAARMAVVRAEVAAMPERVPHTLEISFVASLESEEDTPLRRRLMKGGTGTVTIRLHDLVEQWLNRHRTGALTALEDEMKAHRGQLVKNLQELWNIVRYNLEGAVAEADEHLDPKQKPVDSTIDLAKLDAEAWDKCRELGVGGLERAVLRLRDILERLGTLHEKVLDTYNERFTLTESIRSDAAAAATFRGSLRFWWNELKIRNAALLDLGKARAHKGWLWVRGKALDIWKEARQQSGLVRSVLGLPEEVTTETKPSLEKVDQRLNVENDAVPPVYRRLFAREPLEVDEFMVAREPAFKALNDAAKAWRAGQRTSVLIYGDPGSGKRSLLNVGLDSMAEDATVLNCPLEARLTTLDELIEVVCGAFGIESECPDLESLIQALLEKEKQIVVLDYLQRAFLRRIGGFTALNSLLFLISRTNHHHLWLASLDGHSYALLQRLFRISDAFTHVVPTTSLSSTELQTAILTRHDMSGFRLLYRAVEQPNRLLARELKRAPDAEARNAILGAQFFKSLRNASDGNIFVAVAYWLHSVAGVTGDDALAVQPIEPLEVPSLKRLTQDHQFALCALLQHGDLNATELSQIFNWDVVKSRLALQFFGHRNLTIAIDENVVEADAVRYQVNLLMLKPIVALLSGQHIVYWQTP